MHYADFAEDEVRGGGSFSIACNTRVTKVADSSNYESQSAALLAAIKEYDANKWKVIGTKVGKPAKVLFLFPCPLPLHTCLQFCFFFVKACEQYAKENFAGRV
jgi:hypothetical protein